MSVDPTAFARYVAVLPSQWEPSLVSGDTVSTAFYQALAAGWTQDQLVGDGLAVLHGRQPSIGLLVSRLRGLSQARPGKRTPASRQPWNTHRSGPVTFLPPAMIAERIALLTRIWDDTKAESGTWPEERSHQAMVDIIARQRHDLEETRHGEQT